MKTLSELTEIELKAAAYDNLAQMEQAQANLKVINEELGRRVKNIPQEIKSEKINKVK